jgi:hypothetical protein
VAGMSAAIAEQSALMMIMNRPGLKWCLGDFGAVRQRVGTFGCFSLNANNVDIPTVHRGVYDLAT